MTDLSAVSTDPGQDPDTLLQMLIKLKVEYALACAELDRSRNEISRIKRLSLMNAQPVEQLRKASQDRAAAVAARRAAEGATASAGTPRGSFSSDMLKSTADLLRLKAKARKVGGGTAAGSVSGSVASFSASLFSGMGGGSATMWGSHTTSVRGSVDDDDWELSSQASRVSRDSGSVSGGVGVGASALPVPAYFGGRDVR
jgi:hypothetical protein